jgi:hypothetical protein
MLRHPSRARTGQDASQSGLVLLRLLAYETALTPPEVRRDWAILRERC